MLPAVVLHALLCGFQLLQPKSGLHEAALTAGLDAASGDMVVPRISVRLSGE